MGKIRSSLFILIGLLGAAAVSSGQDNSTMPISFDTPTLVVFTPTQASLLGQSLSCVFYDGTTQLGTASFKPVTDTAKILSLPIIKGHVTSVKVQITRPTSLCEIELQYQG